MLTPMPSDANTPPSSASIPNRGPLEGLVVLDFTTNLSGPLATYFLAGLGATVIKIEEIKGDPVRGYVPFVSAAGLSTTRDQPGAMSLPILTRARGKHSVTLNLKSPEALQIYAELARRADIVVENYASGTADRLGIGYEATRAINPRIIYCSLNGFGTGALPGRKAFDAVIQAMGGVMMASGKAGDPPVRVGLPIADVVAPLFAVMGINAALYERERTGEGEHVDISMLGSLATLLAVEDWRAMGQLGLQMRTGSTVPRASPMGCYRCGDGYIAMAAGGRDALAQALFKAMGVPELARDPRFATLTARMRNDDELTRLIEKWCGERSADEVERVLVDAGIPAAKVLSPADALDEPVLNERGEIVNTRHPTLGEVPGLKTVGMPIRLRRKVPAHGAAAPELGQHNEAIYRDWLGFSNEQLAAWKNSGVF
ncbi:MAG TPA: CoA transferase [Ramlibacter sp.]|nr:CoA transferase [Ramlibacter sp.]